MNDEVISDDLKLESYSYDLDEKRIALRPEEARDKSKLLVYDKGLDRVTYDIFSSMASYLEEGSLLVLNNSKVFPCRVLAKKESGARVELFFLNTTSPYKVLVKSSSKKKVGDVYHLPLKRKAQITQILEEGIFELSFIESENDEKIEKKNQENPESIVSNHDFLHYLNLCGTIPIPPYIRRGIADARDVSDYQTIYAKTLGSVAAPTAGLHFTKDLFCHLREKNIDLAYVTLHVGLGSFLPVKSEKILDHKMHKECYFIERESLEKILAFRREKKKIVAVGTTSLRVLASMGADSDIKADMIYNTDIFLHPQSEIDISFLSGLITNFHLPRSSLLMLVSSLISRKKTLELYQKAIEHDFRFFSYGDSMFLRL